MKKTLSILLAFILVFSAVPMSGIADFIKNIDFNFLSVKASAESENGLTFDLSSDGNSYSVEASSTEISGDIVIPATYNGKPVTDISWSAFSDCKNITGIVIPDSIKSISMFAFCRCSGIKSIVIPDSVTDIIDNNAFGGCSGLESVVLSKNLTSIGSFAFSGCSSLTSITIPYSVKSIGNAAFSGCSSLASITISNSETDISSDAFENTAFYNDSQNWKDGVLYIGDFLVKAQTSISGAYMVKDGTRTILSSAFEDCSSLTSVTMPDSVTNIGGNAFYNCSSLTNITIPNSVTDIGNYAFENCNNLQNITIPASVKNIGNGVFWECDELKVYCYENSYAQQYALKNCSDYEIIICDHSNTAEISEIPASCSSYGRTSGTLCNTCGLVLSGGEKVAKLSHTNANGDCICDVCGKDVYTDENGDNMCDVCGKIISEFLPGQTKHIGIVTWAVQEYFRFVPTVSGNYTFYSDDGCSNGYIYDEDKNVLVSGYSDFDNSFKIEYRFEKNTVYYLGANLGEAKDMSMSACNITLVKSCDHINTVNKEAVPTSCLAAGHTAGIYCEDCKSYITGEEIEKLSHTDENGDCVCDVCNKSLFEYSVTDGEAVITSYTGTSESIVIPSKIDGYSVTGIGDYAFYNDEITSVTISEGITNIEKAAFYSCGSLTAVSLPESLTSIGERAFQYTGITSIAIPDGVKTIGEYAFNNCSSLADIDFGENVEVLGECCFGECNALTQVTLPDSVTTIGDYAFYDCGYLGTVELGKNVEILGEYCFYNCLLENITLPDSVTSIGDYAFCYCKYLEDVELGKNVKVLGEGCFYNCSLKNITLPDSVTSIGDQAFYYCGLTSIAIPSSVTEIGNGCFMRCNYLKSITVNSDNLNYCSANNIVFNKNKTEIIYYLPAKSNTSYTIPNTVKTICYGAFYECANLENIVIPSSVTKIEAYAFSDCSSVCDIMLPDSVTEIGENVFDGCSYLETITLGKNLKNIPDCSFYCCYNLSDIDIPESVTYIGDEAFVNCSCLSDINIPADVTYIGEYAFYGCENLGEINIHYGVEEIGDYAFYDCTSLLSIKIPNSVTYMGSEVFYGCTALTNVALSSNISYISYETFGCCESLTSITIPNSVTYISDIFSGCSSLAEIVIPPSVEYIYEYAFEDCENITIYALNDSFAKTYATEMGISFSALDFIPINGTVDYENNLCMLEKGGALNISDILTVDSSCTSSVELFNKNSSFIGTGSVVTVGSSSYTVIITGDLDGDGVCDVLDALSAEKFANSQGDTPTTAQIYAANGGIAETIDITAYSNVVNQALQ